MTRPSCVLLRAWLAAFALVGLAQLSHAQFSPTPEGGAPTKTTFVRLANNSNAILVEPETPDPVRSRIAIVITHPENINNFNYFIGRELPKRGYRAMMINYYGVERTYYELLAPIANAIRVLRATPGVEKIVLAGHSTGGPEATFYQDVAENGAKACMEAIRTYKCDPKLAENLPRADGVVLIDPNGGSPDRMIGLMPALDPYNPRNYNPALDLFNPANGYDPATGEADYSKEFLDTYFAAQAALANRLIDDALARLEKIEAGDGNYTYDEPFVVAATGAFSGGSKPELAYIGLLSKTHAPHLLLKADGSRSVQIIPQLRQPRMRDPNKAVLDDVPNMETVRSFLSFQGLRFRPDYRMTEDNIYGIEWRSTPNSIVGNVEGVRVPTLIISGTCTSHMVFHELAYDHSAAEDKEYLGVEGANHGMMPCRPEYGDTFNRAFDYVDAWLTKPGRFIVSVASGAAIADTPAQQQAIVQSGYGGVDVLSLQTVPVLAPGPDQVLIRVYAAAVNPVDWKLRAGVGDYAPAPNTPDTVIPGGDVAGVVEKIGSGVSEFKVGDAVFAVIPRNPELLNGAYSQFAVAPTSSVMAKPGNVTYAEAAGLGIAALAGVRAVNVTGVASGQRVLVTGAAGGVGSTAVQAAKAKGAYVIGTASARHHDYLRSIGADEIVDYTQVRFEEAVRNADAVIDTVGDIDDTATRALAALKPGGMYVSVAARNMEPKCAAAGVVCAPRGTSADFTKDLFAQVATLAGAGKLDVHIDKSFPLDLVGLAQEYGAQGRTQGKISLVVDAAEADRK